MQTEVVYALFFFLPSAWTQRFLVALENKSQTFVDVSCSRGDVLWGGGGNTVAD